MKRPGPTARHRLTLTSSVVGAVIVALDGTVLTVAQPTLRRDLGASLVQVQWTSTGYLIAVACLLVFAGRLGDRFGHRRVFAVGSLGFGVTSAGIGLAPGIGWVIGLRVAQGVFGALLQPATLGMLRAVYPPDRIGRPIALRTSAIGLAAAAGPVLGGALVGQFGWRAVFFLNVVPALALGGSALAVREPARSPGPTVRLDLPGACLLAVALACLVRTLVGVPGTGWTAESTAELVVAVVVAAVFVRHERRTANPLLPPAVLGSTTVGAALGILVVASAAMFGTLFAGSCFLQEVLGLDPLQTGLRALPAAVMMVLGAPASAVLMRRFGARRTALAALCVLAAGVLLLSRLDRESTAVPISAGFLLLGGRLRGGDGHRDDGRRAARPRGVGGGGGRSPTDGHERRAHAGSCRRDRADAPRGWCPDGSRSDGSRGRGRGRAAARAAAAGTRRGADPPAGLPRGERGNSVRDDEHEAVHEPQCGGERWDTCDKRSSRMRSVSIPRRWPGWTSTSPTWSTTTGCPVVWWPCPGTARSRTSRHTDGATARPGSRSRPTRCGGSTR